MGKEQRGRVPDDSDVERGPIEPNPPPRRDEERGVDEEE